MTEIGLRTPRVSFHPPFTHIETDSKTYVFSDACQKWAAPQLRQLRPLPMQPETPGGGVVVRDGEKALVGWATTKSGDTAPATVVDGSQTSHSLQLAVGTEMRDKAVVISVHDNVGFHSTCKRGRPALIYAEWWPLLAHANTITGAKEFALRSQDLSLLVIFDAIMTEGSITHAAERLNITQPAVSNAVGRMRAIWKDDLFIKDGRNIRPTLFAQNLWAQVKRPLEEIEDAINPKGFDPATSHRVFRIAATDLMVDIAWADLRQRLEEDAPGVGVQTLPYTIANG